MRIHPHKEKDSQIVEGNLTDWRRGLTPVNKLNPCALDLKTDHYIKRREGGSSDEKKEERAQAGWPPRLSWRRPPRLSWRLPPRLSWCLHTY